MSLANCDGVTGSHDVLILNHPGMASPAPISLPQDTIARSLPAFDLSFPIGPMSYRGEPDERSTPAMALFRLAVLGPLISREHLQRGELKQLLTGTGRA